MRAWPCFVATALVAACGAKSVVPSAEPVAQDASVDSGESSTLADAGTPDEDAGGDASFAGYPITGPLPECSWPASLDLADAQALYTGVYAERFFLECGLGPTGLPWGFGCLSSQASPSSCPGIFVDLPSLDASAYVCFDRCELDEYALRWTPPAPPVAAQCRELFVDQLNGHVDCCPCQ